MNQKQQRIAVAGATGRVGHHVVDVLRERGHDVVSISRSNGVDVVTGEGLDEALRGVDVVVDAATGPSPDEQEATAFFSAAARNLQAAGERAGVQRIVVVSIIGIDRMGGGGYQGAKLVHEKLSQEGPVPATILRAAQFHEFVEPVIGWGTSGGVAHVSNMRTQIVARADGRRGARRRRRGRRPAAVAERRAGRDRRPPRGALPRPGPPARRPAAARPAGRGGRRRRVQPGRRGGRGRRAPAEPARRARRARRSPSGSRRSRRSRRPSGRRGSAGRSRPARGCSATGRARPSGCGTRATRRAAPARTCRPAP